MNAILLPTIPRRTVLRVPLVALLLGLACAGGPAQDAEPEISAPISLEIRNASGEPLSHPRILRFDGARFEVEHDAGIATIPWQRMPEAVKARYPYRPERAEELRRLEAERRAALLQEPAPAAAVPPAEPTPTPEPDPVSTEPVVIRREIRIGDLYILATIGGPAGDLKITNVTQTEVSFSRYRIGGSETRELKLGFGEPRTLLFSDGRGCDVYYVKVFHRERYHVVIEFEYAPRAGRK